MYQQKVPKSEKPDTSSCTVYHCHNTPEPVEWHTRKDYYRIMSIDPGRRNFCFRVEHRNLVTGKITMELFRKIDMILTTHDVKVSTDVVFRNTILVLAQYHELIKDCHLIIIERQLHINYKMVRFSQHIITYLMCLLMDNALKTVILEIAPTLKTRELGAMKGLNKREVKLWAIEKADTLLRAREDMSSLDVIKKAKTKKDDLSDTVVQIEAVFHLFDLPLTGERLKINVDINNINMSKFAPKVEINIDNINFDKLKL
jgi:hypothetical protein